MPNVVAQKHTPYRRGTDATTGDMFGWQAADRGAADQLQNERAPGKRELSVFQ